VWDTFLFSIRSDGGGGCGGREGDHGSSRASGRPGSCGAGEILEAENHRAVSQRPRISGRVREREEDTVLASRARRGDSSAFHELYSRYAPRVFSLALGILGDRFAAEDVVQDTFLSAWRHIAAYESAQGSFAVWITHIAHNKTVDILRRRRRGQGHQVPGTVEDLLALLPDPRPGPDQQSETRWASERVREALGRLPASYREVLVLAYFYGYTHQEIARHTGHPLGTVKTWIRQGLEALRGTLEGGGL